MRSNYKNSKILIIAEAGVNHNGDIDIAKELIRQAASAGADIVKFQTFKAENLLTKDAPMADYQVDDSKEETSSYEMLQNLELSEDDHAILIKECKKENIEFLSTAFDEVSLHFLIDQGISRIKIPSGEITNQPLLNFISKFDLPIILSTGMADLSEIQCAISALCANKLSKKNISILHCTSQYPADHADLNLKAIRSMMESFDMNIGYSDHSLGPEASIAAVALGATIIEKHITLDCKMSGPDHKASMEPKQFKSMVSSIRNIEKSLGDGFKKPTKSEMEMRLVSRKSLIANQNIQKGDVFTLENVAVKRPGHGISPMKINEILGTKSKHSFKVNDLIKI